MRDWGNEGDSELTVKGRGRVFRTRAGCLCRNRILPTADALSPQLPGERPQEGPDRLSARRLTTRARNAACACLLIVLAHSDARHHGLRCGARYAGCLWRRRHSITHVGDGLLFGIKREMPFDNDRSVVVGSPAAEMCLLASSGPMVRAACESMRVQTR